MPVLNRFKHPSYDLGYRISPTYYETLKWMKSRTTLFLDPYFAASMLWSALGSEIGNWSSTMASSVWHNLTFLRFSGFMPYLEAGAGWFVQVREALKVLMVEYNPLRRTSPHVTHKIKMASMHLSMDEVSKTYKITPVRRL